MKIVKKLSVVASIAIFVASAGMAQIANAATEMKVAVVNVQEVLQKSPRVTSISKKLEEQFKSRQAKISGEQKTLQDRMDKYKKDAPTMTQQQKEKTEKDITDERSGLVKQVVAYQQDLQKEQNAAMQQILKDLNGVVGTIAKSGSYSLVLDSQAVIFAANESDITSEVAKNFNK